MTPSTTWVAQVPARALDTYLCSAAEFRSYLQIGQKEPFAVIGALALTWTDAGAGWSTTKAFCGRESLHERCLHPLR